MIKDIIELRRAIHQNPELSGKEKQTSVLVQRELSKYGIEFRTGYSGYGVVAHIQGQNPSKRFVALRADMDALPVNEDTGLPYSSHNKGVMHACGHDVHTACLLGAARLLQESRSNWEGTVLLVFQPSEEKYGGGADVMLKEKALQAFSSKLPQRMYALHVTPELPVGTLGFKAGQYMASTDEIYITVKGKGGHAALPAQRKDTVSAAAKILVELQKHIVSKKLPFILAFGRIIGDGQTNVIPDSVEMAGTLRTFDKTFRKNAHSKINAIAKSIASEYGVKVEVRIDKGYPVLINDLRTTATARNIAESMFKKIEKISNIGNGSNADKKIKDLDLRLTAEDFAFFAEKISSCFFRLGTGKSKGGLHSSQFTIDEKSIEIGVRIMAELGMKG